MHMATKKAMAKAARLMATAPKRAKARAGRGLATGLRWRAMKRAMARAARVMGKAKIKVRSRATRSMPTVTKKAMATAAREEDGGKRDGDGD